MEEEKIGGRLLPGARGYKSGPIPGVRALAGGAALGE